MRPETFVILIPGFAVNETDSTCLPSQQLFVRLLKERFPSLNIIVVAFQYPFIEREYTWHNCRVLALGGKGKSKIFRLLLWRRVWYKLKRINEQNKLIGLLSFWCGECALIGKRFGKKYHIPHYCWIMGQDAKKNNSYIPRVKPAGIELISISDFIQKEFERNHHIAPRYIIPLGIHPAEFSGENILKDIDVLGAGSLIELKQYDLFVEIISRLKEEFPGIKAMLCGKGPEENKLRKMIAASGLQNNIILTGELPHPQLLLQMKKSRILLHTSSYEGFGVVCIEALYAGASVISFCKPMSRSIPKWSIMDTKEEMIKKAIDILNEQTDSYTAVLPYLMERSVEQIMELFGK